MKTVFTGNRDLPLCKSWTSTKWYQQINRFCIHCECSVYIHQASAQAFNCFWNWSASCFQLKEKLMWCQLSLNRINSVVLVITRKIKFIIVLEIYLSHDIISSNLVCLLGVFTLIDFQCQHFWMAKIARWSCKDSVEVSQI